MYTGALPEKLTQKWQITVDLMRQFFDVPAALINRFVNDRIQVEVSGKGDIEYFKRGDSSRAGTGYYCDEVNLTGKQVHIKNANKSKKWAATPKNSKGMISYLGSPIKWPDNSIFGTICVLDLVERDFDAKYLALIDQFRLIIESDLINLVEEMDQIKSKDESEKRYRLLAENAEDVIWTYSLEDQKFTYISPSIERLRGYTVEEAIAQTIEESLSSEAFQLLDSELKNRLNDYTSGKIEPPSRYRYEVQQPHKDGTMVWVEMITSLVTNDDGSPKAIFGVSRDISKRKIIADRIIENERQLSIIFNNAPAMMILINENSEILRINHVGLKMTALEESEAVNLKPGDVLKCINSVKTGDGCGTSDECSKCKLRSTYADTMKTGSDHIKEEANLSVLRDGKCIDVPVLVSSSVVSDAPEKKILVTIDDITDRKKLEYDLVRAKERAEESDSLKTSFLTNMSHEIRTPLNGVVGFSQIITDPNLEIERKKEYAEIINKSAQQLLTIVNNILEISRIETGQVEIRETMVNLNKLIDEVSLFYSIEAELKKLEFKVSKGLPDDSCEISTDPVLLRKILENLTDNALKFTDSGMVTLGYSVENGTIRLFVEDTGIGVEPGNEDIIFERFIKVSGADGRQFGGNGLGLSVSRAYSEKLGGKIYLEPSVPLGTKFIFEMQLPVENGMDQSFKESKIPPQKEIPGKTCTILVVEDEEINYIYTKQILNRLNATVIWAKNGKEAIETVKTVSGITLVLMDIKLPDISGYEVTRQIISESPEMKIIALTAYALAGDREAAIESGCIDYISKPAKADTIISIISKYC